MSIDLNKMHNAIAKANAEVDKAVTTKLRKTAVRVHQTLVFATPIDTGRARNNWLPNLNAPVSSPRLDAKGDGGAILGEGKTVIDSAKAGDAIHFTNNLEYIGALNDGHSAQAPAGFVQKAVQAAKAG